MSEGLLDDLSFEDLEKQAIQQQKEQGTMRRIESEHTDNCGFDKNTICDDECKYYKLCTRSPLKRKIESDFSFFNEYWTSFQNWLAKEGFSTRIIEQYKRYATDDKELFEISDKENLNAYLNQKMSKCRGHHFNFYRNYYKYYIQMYQLK